MHAHPACKFMQVHNVPVIPLYACIFFGGPKACNNSKQTISIDSITKTCSQNKTLPVIPLYAYIFSCLQNAFSLLMHAVHAYTV